VGSFETMKQSMNRSEYFIVYLQVQFCSKQDITCFSYTHDVRARARVCVWGGERKVPVHLQEVH